jgi:hypothetical protein
MVLAPPSRLRRLVHSPEGLYATARVSFHGADEKPLHGELTIRFHAHAAHRGGNR